MSTLHQGTRLGPYEVLSLIGAGGMGEVYRGRDTRLDRAVALKVLKPALALDASSRARFTREARAVSALNHPHICGLYDIGRDRDIDFLVLELLDGETLEERLRRGALPLKEVIRFGLEIADALAAAHLHGIIHRDLKPGTAGRTFTTVTRSVCHATRTGLGVRGFHVEWSPDLRTLDTGFAIRWLQCLCGRYRRSMPVMFIVTLHGHNRSVITTLRGTTTLRATDGAASFPLALRPCLAQRPRHTSSRGSALVP